MTPVGAGFVIETHGLTKSFGGTYVVNDVSLRVPRGSIYGFLGPNGSGKTTTIRMLLGLVTPSSGGVVLLGEEEPSSRRATLARLGVLVEGPGFYPYLSGMENLKRFAEVGYLGQRKRDRSADKLTSTQLLNRLEMVGLKDAANKKYRAYSLGMKQRLAVSAALLWPRDLLILDEPTNGLDPQGIVEIRELLISLRSEGITVFISSHILSEVEMICSDVGVMRDGNLVFQGTIEVMRGSLGERFHLRSSDPNLAQALLLQLGLVDPDSLRIAEDELTASLTTSDIEGVVAALVHGGVGIRSVGQISPSLEEAFVALTGRSGHAR